MKIQKMNAPISIYAEMMNVKHCLITSVNRDDLKESGPMIRSSYHAEKHIF